jgi:hypothetical protein
VSIPQEPLDILKSFDTGQADNDEPPDNALDYFDELLSLVKYSLPVAASALVHTNLLPGSIEICKWTNRYFMPQPGRANHPDNFLVLICVLFAI